MPRILCLDYGTRRIGVAVSDEAGLIAMPLRVVDASLAFSELEAICAEKKPVELVVGLPLNMDGSEGPKAVEARKFAAKLEEKLGIPVRTWDERLSSRQAERALLSGDISRRKRKGVIDKLAAQLVLQSYLDARWERSGRER